MTLSTYIKNKSKKNTYECMKVRAYIFKLLYWFLNRILLSDLCSGEHLDLTKKGNLSINLGFASAFKVNVNIIIYTEYQQVIEIDKNRKVILDFSN